MSLLPLFLLLWSTGAKAQITVSPAVAYDGLGQLVRTSYGNGVTENLTFDIRGWRTGQTVGKGTTDIFSSDIRYNASGYGAASACWNGSIASQSWRHSTAATRSQGYGYDGMNRLVSVGNGTNPSQPASQSYACDRNTNLTSVTDYESSGTVSQSTAYALTGNRRDDCTYDANGNLTSLGDGRTFTYNLLNLPAKSLKNAGTGDEEKVEWRYLADGTKAGGWKWTPSATPSAREGFLYAGPFRLRLDDTDGHGIESVAAPGGRIVYTDTGWQPDYYITDHLGSTRAVLDGTGNVLRSYDYFPYGECIPVSTGTDPEAQYLFSGKEKQDHLFALDWYDSGARFQTADGIFTGIDPLAEKYYYISPYAYCAGNPVNTIDSKGDSIAVLNLGGLIGHTALLIQNDEGKWAYYSMNGDIIYDYSGGRFGGKGYHDLGNKAFEDVKSFLISDYNSKGTSKQIENDEINNYGFFEAYIIPSTKEQDKTMIKTFQTESNTTYHLFSHNCAIVAGRSILSADIQATDGHTPNSNEIISFRPQWFFNNIKKIYKGTYVTLPPLF